MQAGGVTPTEDGTREVKLLLTQAMPPCSRSSSRNAPAAADLALFTPALCNSPFLPSCLPQGPPASIRDGKEALNKEPGAGRGRSRSLWERSPQVEAGGFGCFNQLSPEKTPGSHFCSPSQQVLEEAQNPEPKKFQKKPHSQTGRLCGNGVQAHYLH